MMATNYVKIAVAVLVAVIVAVSVVLPIMASGEQAAKTATYSNTGTTLEYIADTETEYTMTFTNGAVVLNDVSYSVTDTSKYIYSDALLGAGYTTATSLNVDVYTSAAVVNGIKSIVFNNGTATLTDTSDNTYTATYTWFAFSAASGNYVLTSGAAYVPDDVTTTWVYPTNNAIVNVGFVVNTEDGAATSVNGATRSGSTLTDVSASVTAAVSVENDKTTVTATYSDTAYTLGAIVPASVSIYDENRTSIVITIVSILPVLIMVGVLVMVVGAAVANRRA